MRVMAFVLCDMGGRRFPVFIMQIALYFRMHPTKLSQVSRIQLVISKGVTPETRIITMMTERIFHMNDYYYYCSFVSFAFRLSLEYQKRRLIHTVCFQDQATYYIGRRESIEDERTCDAAPQGHPSCKLAIQPFLAFPRCGC
jgi:hypothetical protein